VVYYDTNVLATQMFYGVIGNWFVNKLKTSRFVPFLNTINTQNLNRIVALGIAAVSMLGIEYKYSYTPDGLFVLSLSGVTVASIWQHVQQFGIAYMAQQASYHAMKPTDATATATATVLTPGPKGTSGMQVEAVEATAGVKPPTNGV
jgi:hypothetical protein